MKRAGAIFFVWCGVVLIAQASAHGAFAGYADWSDFGWVAVGSCSLVVGLRGLAR